MVILGRGQGFEQRKKIAINRGVAKKRDFSGPASEQSKRRDQKIHLRRRPTAMGLNPTWNRRAFFSQGIP